MRVTMSMMMEQVHQRASRQHQVWQHTQHVRPVFGPKIEAGRGQETQQRQPAQRLASGLQTVDVVGGDLFGKVLL